MIGLEQWFANFTQYSWTDNSPESLAEIPRPVMEYMIYGTFKSAEIASFVGGLVVHPLYRIYLRSRVTPETMTNNTFKIIRTQCRRLQGRFLIGGLVAGPLTTLAYIQLSGMSERELKDKCYQVRCNAKELTWDRTTLCLGFIGWYWKRFQGAVDGINLALLYAIVNEKLISKHTTPILFDKVQVEDRLPGGHEERDSTMSALRRFLRERKISMEEEKKDE
ncbi:hypothetical protein L596_012360 [Steinernema carpocapsae]|nr:hypothetical protein L596_012360 [Steinernema carpocapsae]